MKSLPWCAFLVAMMPAIASAQGINLSWDLCGAAGVAGATWACDSNTGTPFTLVASFVPPANLPEFVGLLAQIDITASTALPDWWRHGLSLCRGAGAISSNFDFTSGPCTDPYSGLAAGGFTYDVGFVSANRVRWRFSLGVPFESRIPVNPGIEYHAFKANLQRSNSTGPGHCPGCSEPACIVLNEIQLIQPPERKNDPLIVAPPSSGRNYVLWQSASVPGCPQSTPVQAATWGRLKSLYR